VTTDTLREAAEDALAPCPFCGGEPYVSCNRGYVCRDVDCSDHTHWLNCEKCYSEGPTVRYRNEAISAWNTRAARDAWEPVTDRISCPDGKTIDADEIAITIGRGDTALMTAQLPGNVQLCQWVEWRQS